MLWRKPNLSQQLFERNFSIILLKINLKYSEGEHLILSITVQWKIDQIYM